MKNRLGKVLAVVLVPLFFAACGSDSKGPLDPGGGGNQLSREETLEVFFEILGAIGEIGIGFDAAPAGVAAAPIAFATITFNETVPCENGGSIEVAGALTIDESMTMTGDFVYSLTETPKNCGITTESGNSYRVNGSPSLQVTGSAKFVDGEPVGAFDMSFTGGLSWVATSGGGSGSCAVNMKASLNMQTAEATVEGTICGYSYDETMLAGF